MVIVCVVESLAQLAERIAPMKDKRTAFLRSRALLVGRLGAVDSTGRFTPSILQLYLIVTSVARHH